MIIIKPITTEKTVKLVEGENTLVFEVEVKASKEEIKKVVENLFGVKVKKIRTMIRKNRKIAYIKLDEGSAAIDVATKLGIM